jgi:putative hemolysin
MKTQLIILGFVLGIVLIAGCQRAPPIIGGDKDEHGCLIAAGYSWCEAKQKCLRTWEENCTQECGTCPQLSPPGPEFCKDGTIMAGEKNECGCQGPPKCLRACTEEAKLCPDGTAVGRNGSNNCEFDPCPSIGMANPASVFCIAQGGESKIIAGGDSAQLGLCILKDGTICDEWAYFRGECPEKHVCTEAEKTAEACTMEYMPTCGDDGVTYGNKCSACASKKIDSYTPGECPTKTYVSRDLEQCKVIRYLCIKGKVPFSDDFGCGCEPEKTQSTCGNGICDLGEADACPACYYSTPPCLAPCTAGTCPEDCTATTGTGKLKANDCLPEERAPYICPTLNSPVCGWRNVTLVCPNPPCKSTYANKCTACLDSTVAYWTDGECPN